MGGGYGRKKSPAGTAPADEVRSASKLVRNLAKKRRTSTSPPEIFSSSTPTGKVLTGTEDAKVFAIPRGLRRLICPLSSRGKVWPRPLHKDDFWGPVTAFTFLISDDKAISERTETGIFQLLILPEQKKD